MSAYSEQDLKYASELREGVHREALAIVRKTRPHITEVVDRHPVEDYFQEHWDYPGKWYTIVAIPSGYGSRGAFLHPPHGVRYTDADFDRVNAALFPKGTDALEVYRWTTDWSEYFDDGREWWGTLCLTVYDKKPDRFVVILASATD